MGGTSHALSSSALRRSRPTSRVAKAVERLVRPAPEVDAAGSEVEESIPDPAGLPHLQFDERAALSRVSCQCAYMPVSWQLIRISRRSSRRSRRKLVSAPSDRVLRDLHVLVALLEALSPHLDDPRPPFRIAAGRADEAPYHLERSVEVGMLAVCRHSEILSPPAHGCAPEAFRYSWIITAATETSCLERGRAVQHSHPRRAATTPARRAPGAGEPPGYWTCDVAGERGRSSGS